jgi:hypothetical protein
MKVTGVIINTGKELITNPGLKTVGMHSPELYS